MVGGEILIDQQRTSKRDNRYQIGWRHLRINVTFSGSSRAIDFVRLHPRKVEEQNNQAPVFKLICGIGACCDGSRTSLLGCDSTEGLRLSHIHISHRINVFDIERSDLLRLVVFQDRKVFWLQSAEEVPTLVPHSHIDQHQFARSAKGIVPGLLRCQGRAQECDSHQKGQELSSPSARIRGHSYSPRSENAQLW